MTVLGELEHGDHADDFDICRHPNLHVAFGKGKHFCLGAPLARLELDILFHTLLQRLPRLQMDGDQPSYRTGLVFRGLQQLQVRW